MASRSLRFLRLNLDFKHMPGPLGNRRRLARRISLGLSPVHPTLFECASAIITTVGVEHLGLLMHDGSVSLWDQYDLRDGECVIDYSSWYVREPQ